MTTPLKRVVIVTLLALLMGCSNETGERTIYTALDDSLPMSQIKVHGMKVIQETEDKLLVELDYTYKNTIPPEEIRVFILPDHGYWSEKNIDARYGRNRAQMIIGLSKRNMEKDRTYESSTTVLRVSFDHYLPKEYKGSIHREVIPFEKQWRRVDDE